MKEEEIMDVLRYNTALKASGDEYKKIVFWNRFLRNKLELILSFLPACLSIVLICMGFNNTYLLMLYVIFWAYPFFIYTQFKNSVRYHLKHRDQSESAPCEITLMPTGILAEIPDYDVKYIYHWEDFTTIYDKFGYYMMLKKGQMLVMLRQADMPDGLKEQIVTYMKQNVNQNECMFRF